MSDIHSTAIIGQDVVIGEGVKIHPYCILEGKIEIGDGCEIGPYVYIKGWVQIGKNTKIYAGAVIGEDPQDHSYDGVQGLVQIGSDCLIREYVTIHSPVVSDKGNRTICGNHVMLMATSHMGHNSVVEDNAILANSALLAGYVQVGKGAFLSGNVAVHQFCRIGAYVIIGAVSKAAADIPPFAMSTGSPAVFHGLNVVGLRRNGFDQNQRSAIKGAYSILYSGKGYRDALEEIKATYPDDPNVNMIVEFVSEALKNRGIASLHGR